jgi:hypothetical protein
MLHRSNATCHQALHGIWFIVEIDGAKAPKKEATIMQRNTTPMIPIEKP